MEESLAFLPIPSLLIFRRDEVVVVVGCVATDRGSAWVIGIGVHTVEPRIEEVVPVAQVV
jgi:hypothetical protein